MDKKKVDFAETLRRKDRRRRRGWTVVVGHEVRYVIDLFCVHNFK